MTVKELLVDLKKAIEKDHSILNKQILLSDDDEGNSYHEMYFSITADADDVKENIEFSNGVSGVDITDYSKYVILG